MEGCGKVLRSDNTTGYCTQHRKQSLAYREWHRTAVEAVREERRPCGAEGCDRSITRQNTTGYCREHGSATSRVPTQYCAAEGCEKALRSHNQSGYCAGHHKQSPTYQEADLIYREAERERIAEQRRMCGVGGCGKPVQRDNQSGYCTEHRWPGSRVEVRICAAEGCRTELRSHNHYGYCRQHRHLSPVLKEQLRAYAEAAKEEVDAYQRAYREANRERLAEFQRAYRDANLEKIVEERRARYEADPERYRSQSRIRRALEYCLFVEPYGAEEVLARTGGLCHLCAEPVDLWDIHLDHVVPLSWGGPDCLENVAAAHASCNSSKRNLTWGGLDSDLNAVAVAAYAEHHGHPFDPKVRAWPCSELCLLVERAKSDPALRKHAVRLGIVAP